MSNLKYMDTRPFIHIIDLILIPFVIYAVFNWSWFAGGWGWVLLLGLSPSAWRK